MSREAVASRFFVSGRVQGVGYRYFVEHHANELGLTGYARNLEDGRVEVYVTGSREALEELRRLLWQGPRWSGVRQVDEETAEMESCFGFRIRF